MKLTNAITWLGVLVAAGLAGAQESEVGSAGGNFAPYLAEVSTKTLHVRSGPSTNYYPVLRLSAGAQVQVVGQEAGWLAIAPPPGCFSLIATKYVDREGVRGTVNADNVRVRAGSELSPHNYAIQVKLSRGAAVNILGPMDAEFLKIESPAGARVWVAGEYVRRAGQGGSPPPTSDPAASPSPDAVGAATDHSAIIGPPAPSAGVATDVLATAPKTTVPAPTGETEFPSGDEDDVVSAGLTPASISAPSKTSVEPPVPSALASTASSLPASPATHDAEAESRANELESLDVQLNAEMAKPLLERDLAPLLPRYRELAEQSGDEYTQAYSRIRVEQIEAVLEMIDGVRSVGKLREQVHTVRQTALKERSGIRHVPVRADGGFDAEGELRPSAVYASPLGPRRFRLVDPKTSPARTIGYVEIPYGVELDMSNLLGRRVAIRARDRILTPGDVDPLSIYIPSEIVVLEQAADGSTRIASSIRIPAAVTAPGPEITSTDRP